MLYERVCTQHLKVIGEKNSIQFICFQELPDRVYPINLTY